VACRQNGQCPLRVNRVGGDRENAATNVRFGSKAEIVGHSRRQLLAKAAIAASRVGSQMSAVVLETPMTVVGGDGEARFRISSVISKKDAPAS